MRFAKRFESEALRDVQDEIGFTLIQKEKHQGYMVAARDALLIPTEDFIMLCDSDGTHDPSDIRILWSRRQHKGIVAGTKTDRKDTLLRRMVSAAFNRLVRLTFNLPAVDINAGFKLVAREVAQDVVPNICHLRHGFTTELVIRANAMDYKVVSVAVTHRERMGGCADEFTITKLTRVVCQQFTGLRRLKHELRTKRAKRTTGAGT